MTFHHPNATLGAQVDVLLGIIPKHLHLPSSKPISHACHRPYHTTTKLIFFFRLRLPLDYSWTITTPICKNHSPRMVQGHMTKSIFVYGRLNRAIFACGLLKTHQCEIAPLSLPLPLQVHSSLLPTPATPSPYLSPSPNNGGQRSQAMAGGSVAIKG